MYRLVRKLLSCYLVNFQTVMYRFTCVDQFLQDKNLIKGQVMKTVLMRQVAWLS